MDKSLLIHKVLSGDATEAEKAELNDWISSDPNNAEEYEDLKLLYEGSVNIEEKINERDDQYYSNRKAIHF
jgi:ferric-dicitrate binding protein FerR (iron transport regulator)